MSLIIIHRSLVSLMTLKALSVQLLLLITFQAQFPAAFAQQGETPGRTAAHGSGEIRGKVAVTPNRESHDSHVRDLLFGRYATQGGTDASILAERDMEPQAKLSEKAVVYLEGGALARERYAPPIKDPILDQKHLQFHPQVLPILVGTTVDFPNRDNLFHNVFSYSQPKEFDLGRYPKDDSKSVTFDRPGVVRVYCDIHSHMNATILVLPHPYFAVPDDDGRYIIRHVPDGRYTLVFWYDRDVVERRPVEIKAGEVINEDFTID